MAGRVIPQEVAEELIIKELSAAIFNDLGFEVVFDHRPDKEPGTHLAKGGRADAFFKGKVGEQENIVAEITQVEPLPMMQGTFGVMGERLRNAAIKILLPSYPGHSIDLVVNLDEVRKPWPVNQVEELVTHVGMLLTSATKDYQGVKWASVQQDEIKFAAGLIATPSEPSTVWAVRVETSRDLKNGTRASMRHALKTNNDKLQAEKLRLFPTQSLLVLDAWDLANFNPNVLARAFAEEWKLDFSAIDHVLVARFLGQKPSFFPLKVGVWRYDLSTPSHQEFYRRMRGL